MRASESYDVFLGTIRAPAAISWVSVRKKQIHHQELV